MVRLFWTQNENPTIPNTIIDSNGKLMTLDRSSEMSNKLVSDLFEYQEISKVVFNSGNLTIKKYKNRGFFISSNFSDKDESGRSMAFMFFTENNHKEEVIKDLLFFSGLVKRKLVEQDVQNIYKNINKQKKQIVKLIAAAIAILIIYMLWKSNN